MSIKPDLRPPGLTTQHYADLVGPSLEGLGVLITQFIRRIDRATPRIYVEVTSEDEESFFKSYYIKNGKLNLPLIRIQKQTISRLDSPLNQHVMSTDGINIGLTKDRAHSLIVHAFSRMVSQAVSFYTNDYQQADNFINALMMVEGDRVEYNVDWDDPKFRFPVRAVFSDTMDYPVSSSIDESFKGWRVDTQVGIRTWQAMVERVPNIEKLVFQPIVAERNEYDAIVERIDAIVGGNDTIEPWSPDSMTFTIDLGKYANSDTND